MSPRNGHVHAVGLASIEIQKLQDSIFDLLKRSRADIRDMVTYAVGHDPIDGPGKEALHSVLKISAHLAEAIDQCEKTKGHLTDHSQRL